MLQRLEEIFKELYSKADVQWVEFNGEQDHVHLLIQYRPKIAISVLVNSLKAVSSRYLQKEFAFEIKKNFGKEFSGVVVILQELVAELPPESYSKVYAKPNTTPNEMISSQQKHI